jgi:hypothetical protein
VIFRPMPYRAIRPHTNDLISAAEIGCYAFCPETWRLEYGLGLEAGNREQRVAGIRHHSRKAAAERVAGGSIWLGRIVAMAAFLWLLWLLWGWR